MHTRTVIPSDILDTLEAERTNLGWLVRDEFGVVAHVVLRQPGVFAVLPIEFDRQFVVADLDEALNKLAWALSAHRLPRALRIEGVAVMPTQRKRNTVARMIARTGDLIPVRRHCRERGIAQRDIGECIYRHLHRYPHADKRMRSLICLKAKVRSTVDPNRPADRDVERAIRQLNPGLSTETAQALADRIVTNHNAGQTERAWSWLRAALRASECLRTVSVATEVHVQEIADRLRNTDHRKALGRLRAAGGGR